MRTSSLSSEYAPTRYKAKHQSPIKHPAVLMQFCDNVFSEPCWVRSQHGEKQLSFIMSLSVRMEQLSSYNRNFQQT